jgi:tetratricopeptide (TPR) repeat protein
VSFFKNFFGKKEQINVSVSLEQKFDADWQTAQSRFFAVTKLNVSNFNLKHPETHETMLPHEGLGGTFSDWQQIESEYDKRGVLFNQLYEMLSGAMNDWQTANYHLLDRHADVALMILEDTDELSVEDADYADYCASKAKAFINSGMYEEALDWAEKAFENAPNDNIIHTLLADTKHINGQCEEAHEIYSTLMKQIPINTTENINEMFHDLFARDTGIVPSPVLAFDMLEKLENSEQTRLFWQLAETEFYDSAYFRMQHAYHLAKIDKTTESFAKLHALVGEMPWLKEASLNLANYFEQFDPTGETISPEFQVALRQRIKDKGWTTEGMREIEM